MRSVILLLLLVNSGVVFANEFLTFGVDNYESKESKWQFDLGANYLDYPTYMPQFEGRYYTAKDIENHSIYGPSIGIGRDLHVAGGLSLSAKVGGFYYWTFNDQVGKASKDVDIDLANNKRTHKVYGSNASLSLNYIFEGESLDVQPFILGGIGIGKAEIERKYKYLGLDTGDATQEENREVYDIKMEDTFSYREVGVGVNFISKRGIVTFFKVSKTTLALNNRKLKGKVKTQGELEKNISENSSKKKEYEVTSASVVIGFLF